MTDEVVARRVVLVPLTITDAAEMVTVLADDDLYAFTGSGPPTLPELRARYARLVAGHSADGEQEWRKEATPQP